MTARVALIGRPLRRRHSEVMHNAAFDRFGVDARYELCELEPGDLARFVEESRGADWLGFQVTAPYKQDVVERCDRVEPAAEDIGAVNSVLRCPDGSLTGFNTDLTGFVRAVGDDLGVDLDGADVVVAGAGGAARAVVVGALRAGARSVTVGNRTQERAQALAEAYTSVSVATPGSDAFEMALAQADLAVNATTVGMTSPGVPFDVGPMAASAAVFDLVYVPAETQLVRAARARGLRAANGAGMLVAQAEAAFERWTGVVGAGAVMLDALYPLLERCEAP